MNRNSCEWLERVVKRWNLGPPSGFNPNAAAVPSSKVDLPEPFSPTKNVTGVVKASVVRWRIAGTEKGNSPAGTL